MEMEMDEKRPSEITRDLIYLTVDMGILDSRKKRKLQADELDLPALKHFRLEPASVAGPCYPLDRFLRKAEEGEECETFSTQSFSENYDSAECSYSQYSACDSSSRKTPSVDSPSSASVTVSSCMFKDSCYSVGSASSTKKELESDDFASSSKDNHLLKDYDKTQMYEDESLDFIHSEFVVEDLEQLADAEIQDFVPSQDVNAGSLVLSSGRWNITNQDARKGTRKPTIDQEFERYFSELMM